MRNHVRKNSNHPKGLVSQLATEKKAVTALCLIGVMAIMWIRVFSKQAPETAGAEIAVDPSNKAVQSSSKLKVSFVDLPKVAGRNDVINRDVFACENWRHFIEIQQKRRGIEEVIKLSNDVNEEVIRKLGEKLKLEAVMVSEVSQAYVNGEPVQVGSKMLIRVGMNKYECEVVVIEENSVVMKCKEAEITLKLVEGSMADN